MKARLSLSALVAKDEKMWKILALREEIRKPGVYQDPAGMTLEQQFLYLGILKEIARYNVLLLHPQFYSIIAAMGSYSEQVRPQIVSLFSLLVHSHLPQDAIYCIFLHLKAMDWCERKIDIIANLIVDCPYLLEDNYDFFLRLVDEIKSYNYEAGTQLLVMMAKWTSFRSASFVKAIEAKANKIIITYMQTAVKIDLNYLSTFTWIYVYLGTGTNWDLVDVPDTVLMLMDQLLPALQHALFKEFVIRFAERWMQYIGSAKTENGEEILRIINAYNSDFEGSDDSCYHGREITSSV